MPRLLSLIGRGLVLSGATVFVTLAVAKMACAAVASEMLAAGTSLFTYARALHAERPEAVVVNGLKFEVSSTSTSDGLDAVLDHFEAACRAMNRGMRDAADGARRASPVARRVLGTGSFDGTFSVRNAGRGIVLCLDPPLGARDAQSPLARVKAFLASGDLADVGEIRFVSAVHNPKTTTYVTVRTHGALPLRRAFPAQGDAPGEDVEGIPRPTGATRRLSAWAQGGAAGAAIAVYEARAGAPLALLGGFRDALAAAGWSSRTDPRDESRFLASLADRRVVVVATRDRQTNLLVVLAL